MTKHLDCDHQIPEWMEEVQTLVNRYIPETVKDTEGRILQNMYFNTICMMLKPYVSTRCDHKSE